MGQCKSKNISYSEDFLHFKKTYTIASKIGIGGFGTVYRAQHNQWSNDVVVKKINKKNLKIKELLEDNLVPREVKIMAGISHSNIIQLIDFYSLPKNYFLILECLPGWVDMFDFTANIRYLEEEPTKVIMKQLFQTMVYLHTEIQVAHLDIKPENILINPADLSIKLIDFGAASYITGKSLTDFEGTRLYACPDILFKGKFNPVDADIWAAGVTLYRLLIGSMPFNHPEDYYEELSFPAGRKLTLYCKHIISLLLCRQSDLRPTSAATLLQLPWILS